MAKMAAGADDFEDWLSSKVRSLELDEEVFLDYLKGVLDSEESEEDKREAMTGIFEGAVDSEVDDICQDILNKWNHSHISAGSECSDKSKHINADSKIKSIIEKQQATKSIPKSSVSADSTYKQRLLTQYANVSDDEEDATDSDEENKRPKSNVSKKDDSLLSKNVNAQMVEDKQREQREKLKKQNEDKKQQDKMNREVQKLKKQEREDKEKKRTQKGERKSR